MVNSTISPVAHRLPERVETVLVKMGKFVGWGGRILIIETTI